MRLYQLVLKDVMRRRRRVLYAALGVVLGIMTFVGVLTMSSAAQERIYRQLDKYGANLTVSPAVSSLDQKLGDLTIGTLTVGENYISEDKVIRMRDIANNEIEMALGIKDETGPAVVAPRLFLNASVSGRTVTAVGVDPLEERKLKVWWRTSSGRFLEKPGEALIGSRLAEILPASVGDWLTLGSGRIVVVGVLAETGSADDYQVFAPLGTVQDSFGKPGMVSAVDIRALCNACPVETIADSINQNIAGVRAVAVKQIADNEMDVVSKLGRFLLALAVVTLLVGGFGVVNTMLTSVHERRKDIGIMRAVGASRGQVGRVLVYEGALVGVIGGVLGYIGGSLLAYLLSPIVFDGTVALPVWSYTAVALILALGVGVGSSAYPAARATRVPVAESLRSL
ncbi:MAG: FtsX-like permease family protein [Chloroflexota bacterium]